MSLLWAAAWIVTSHIILKGNSCYMDTYTCTLVIEAAVIGVSVLYRFHTSYATLSCGILWNYKSYYIQMLVKFVLSEVPRKFEAVENANKASQKKRTLGCYGCQLCDKLFWILVLVWLRLLSYVCQTALIVWEQLQLWLRPQKNSDIFLILATLW